MFVKETELKPLGGIELKPDEVIMLKWLRSVSWQQSGTREPIAYKAKIPEFFGGVRLYQMQAGGVGGQGALEFFIKRLSIQGVITKTQLYPIEGHGSQPRYVSLIKADLDNLGIGKESLDEE